MLILIIAHNLSDFNRFAKKISPFPYIRPERLYIAKRRPRKMGTPRGLFLKGSSVAAAAAVVAAAVVVAAAAAVSETVACKENDDEDKDDDPPVTAVTVHNKTPFI